MGTISEGTKMGVTELGTPLLELLYLTELPPPEKTIE